MRYNGDKILLIYSPYTIAPLVDVALREHNGDKILLIYSPDTIASLVDVTLREHNGDKILLIYSPDTIVPLVDAMVSHPSTVQDVPLQALMHTRFTGIGLQARSMLLAIK
jgi:hypothetical protein